MHASTSARPRIHITGCARFDHWYTLDAADVAVLQSYEDHDEGLNVVALVAVLSGAVPPLLADVTAELAGRGPAGRRP
jgi:hypothetical protein